MRLAVWPLSAERQLREKHRAETDWILRHVEIAWLVCGAGVGLVLAVVLVYRVLTDPRADNYTALACAAGLVVGACAGVGWALGRLHTGLVRRADSARFERNLPALREAALAADPLVSRTRAWLASRRPAGG